MLNSPEPDYRRVLRETDAKMKTVAGRMQHLHMLLAGLAVEGSVGAEWQPLEGVQGCETRLVQNAFVMQARYEAGSGHTDVAVEQAVYGQVTAGRFLLRRHELDTEPVAYGPGQLFHLAPGEHHAWQAETKTVNLIAFVPTTQL